MRSWEGKRVFMAAALVLVTAGYWWLTQISRPPVHHETESGQGGPDYYMDNFEVTVMGDSGLPVRRLSAASMQHYSDNDSAALEEPHLVIYNSGRVVWDIRADNGLLTRGGRTIRLRGKVLIQKAGVAQDRDLEIVTRDLDVDPEREYGVTGKAVTIRNHFGVINAVGMRVDIKKRRVHLLSHVRGRYESRHD